MMLTLQSRRLLQAAYEDSQHDWKVWAFFFFFFLYIAYYKYYIYDRPTPLSFLVVKSLLKPGSKHPAVEYPVLGFACFVVLNLCVLCANRVDLGFLVS